MEYNDFLKSKAQIVTFDGIECDPNTLNPSLFDFQRDIVVWALKKGRSAIFAGTGLGKTIMQCEWARIVGKTIIFAPLAVARQTVEEAHKFGITVKYCTDQSDVDLSVINITNYERIQNFDLSVFRGVVLDESSILKSMTGKVRSELIKTCSAIPYRLACTATPAPNDHMELCNHAEFLGVMTSQEMLATFFTHDGGDTSKWRLKGHAVEKFWTWVASWAVMLTNPSDLGYNGDMFELPPLTIKNVTVETESDSGFLFPLDALTLQERQQARRDSINDRARKTAELVNSIGGGQWLIWCNLNSEADAITKYIPNAVEVRGSDSVEKKEQSAIDFANGKISVLVSKPTIFGMGLNFQLCHRMIFVGLSDSFEQYYQSVRRCWRFGQTQPVDVYIITADREGAVVANIERKEKDFNAMLKGMISATQEITKQNIRHTQRAISEYNPQIDMVIPDWLRTVA